MFVIEHLRRHTVGYLALFVALSGSAYAASALPANSVGTAQVKNHSLLKADFKAGQIPAGKAGKPGSAGARGPAGTFNASNVSRVSGPMAVMCPLGAGDCAIGASTAACPGGSVAIGGGWMPDADNPAFATVLYNGPTDTGWGIIMINDTSSFGGNFQAVAVCASGGTKSLAQRGRSNLSALLARLRAAHLANG